MPHSGLQEGAVIHVRAFEGSQQLDVRVLSAQSIDTGSSAIILKGEMALSGTQTGLCVALKVFPSVLSEVKQELLHRELRAARLLRHRSILPFIGTAVVGLHMIIVAQYMKNGNMLQYLRRSPDARRRQLLSQLAHAVHFLHVWAGVIHGDLKCENVLISDDGEALLADFGLSTLVDKAESSTTTATGIRQQNTIRFAAPELLLGEPDAELPANRQRSKSTMSDVYAFGMLVLQAFTGKEPWYGYSIQAVLRNVCLGELHPRPGEQATALGFNDAWWHLCISTWMFDPKKRPSMANIRDRLNPPPVLETPLNAPRPGTLEARPKRPPPGPHDPIYLQRSDPRSIVRSVAFLPGGNHVACCWDDGRIMIIEVGNPSSMRTLRYARAITCLAVSHDGLRIFTGSKDATLQIWDLATNSLTRPPLHGHNRLVTCVAFSAATNRLVSGSGDSTVRVWDAVSGEPHGTPFMGHSRTVRCVACSPSDALVASGSQDCTIRLWDQDGSEVRSPLTGHTCEVTSLDFSPCGLMLASGSMDDTIRLWNVESRTTLHVLTGHKDYITCVAFSPVGRFLASSGWDNTIRLWDSTSGAAVGPAIKWPKQALLSIASAAMSIAFSLDGASVVFGSFNGRVGMLKDVLAPRTVTQSA